MIERTMVPAVKRIKDEGTHTMHTVSEEIEVETYESGWLSLTQDQDCITIEPVQLRAIIAAAKKAGWEL